MLIVSKRICLWNERRTQCRWKSVPNLHHHVDHVRLPSLKRVILTTKQWIRDLSDPLADDMHSRYYPPPLPQFNSNAIPVRLSLWCPSWECIWVIVTFASAAVKTPQQLYACRFLVGLAEGTFYPAVHTVLGGWYTKRELAKRACIFFGSAFVGSMFSGYLVCFLRTKYKIHLKGYGLM